MAYDLKSPPSRRGRAREGVNGNEFEIKVSMDSISLQSASTFGFRIDLLN